MPLNIDSRFDKVSLAELMHLQEQGYSLLKTPHVGNQHPSNLVCAALGFPLEMVSLTQGVRDRNFHPHLKIVGGQAQPLYDQSIWTPFATVPDGRSAIEYHQSAVRSAFPGTFVTTELELFRAYPVLAATVLQTTNEALPGLWYRQIDVTGLVRKQSVSRLRQSDLETNVFGFSNDQSGWMLPNRVALIFDFVYQALSSGRSVIYPLSGPQMSGYIGGMVEELSFLYDAVRQRIPDLPLVLEVRIVPVAAARFATKRERSSELRAVCEVLATFGDKVANGAYYHDVSAVLPELLTPIESAATLSQYDLSSADALVVDPWLMETSLAIVAQHYEQLVRWSKVHVTV